MQRILNDKDGVEWLAGFAFCHRAAIATHSFRLLQSTTNPADRLSLTIEVYENFIAAVEAVEMLYFALREHVTNPAKPLVVQFARIFIKEEYDPKNPAAGPPSAARLLRELHRTSVDQFASMLGLPDFNEYLSLYKKGQPGTKSELLREYRRWMTDLRRTLRRAVSNRRSNRLMQTYNKLKHGFVVLYPGQGTRGFIVRSIRKRNSATAYTNLMPVEPNEDKLNPVVVSTQVVSKLGQQLLQLHFRLTVTP